MSRRRSDRCSSSSTQKLYAALSTGPSFRTGSANTRRRHDPVTRSRAISSAPIFFRPISPGSCLSALTTSFPVPAAPKSMTSTSSLMKPRTVP